MWKTETSLENWKIKGAWTPLNKSNKDCFLKNFSFVSFRSWHSTSKCLTEYYIPRHPPGDFVFYTKCSRIYWFLNMIYVNGQQCFKTSSDKLLYSHRKYISHYKLTFLKGFPDFFFCWTLSVVLCCIIRVHPLSLRSLVLCCNARNYFNL